MSPNDVITAIRNRRSVREFTDDKVTRESLGRWIEAACWAPNHRLTEPWRFVVLEHGGAVRQSIADLARQQAYDLATELPAQKRETVADAARSEVLDSPALLYVYALSDEDEEISRENYAAVCCAVQNFQLAAHSEGYAVGWSTGKLTRISGLVDILGVDPAWQMVGVLFAGKAIRLPRAQRLDSANAISWL